MILKSALVAGFVLVNRVLGPLIERLLHAGNTESKDESWPPIFIVGAPRSGTTLTFQLIVHAFKVGYLTNMHCKIFGAPVLASRLMRNDHRHITFLSNYGRTAGRYGPSECGEWWYRFFPRDPVYVKTSDISSRKLEAFRRSLVAFAAAEGRPVVFKNLYASLRIDPILSMFPNAIFIHVMRNRVDNAASILEGRMAANGEYDTWWSVPPPGYEYLRELSPARQVMSQIAMIDDQIEQDIRRLMHDECVLNVRYEEICNDPNRFVYQFVSFMRERGHNFVPIKIPTEGIRPKSRERSVPEDMLAELLDISREGSADV